MYKAEDVVGFTFENIISHRRFTVKSYNEKEVESVPGDSDVVRKVARKIFDYNLSAGWIKLVKDSA